MNAVSRISAALTAAALAVALPGATSLAHAEEDLTWQDVKSATARFHSLVQAEQDGYRLASPCTFSPSGAMGFHFENPELMVDPAVDPLQPEILLYAPGPSGNLELVGVEYWMAESDHDVALGSAPAVLGQRFNGPMPGHHPGMPAHYDLHVWLWQANPLGTFAQFNPTVHC